MRYRWLTRNRWRDDPNNPGFESCSDIRPIGSVEAWRWLRRFVRRTLYCRRGKHRWGGTATIRKGGEIMPCGRIKMKTTRSKMFCDWCPAAIEYEAEECCPPN